MLRASPRCLPPSACWALITWDLGWPRPLGPEPWVAAAAESCLDLGEELGFWRGRSLPSLSLFFSPPTSQPPGAQAEHEH